MNENDAEKPKKILIPAGIFAAALLLLWGVFYLGSLLKQDVYFKAAAEIVKDSPDYEPETRPEIERGGAIFNRYPDFCTAVFRAHGGGRQYYAVFVRIYGSYGPYQGLFLYNVHTGAEFCGLTGVQNRGKKASFYGIGRTAIDVWKKKIEKSFYALEQKGS